MGGALSDGAAPAVASQAGASRCSHPGEGSCGCWFLHVLPTLAPGPEGGCATLLSITHTGEDIGFSMNLRHLDPRVK